jgi:hypothetical protein
MISINVEAVFDGLDVVNFFGKCLFEAGYFFSQEIVGISFFLELIYTFFKEIF